MLRQLIYFIGYSLLAILAGMSLGFVSALILLHVNPHIIQHLQQNAGVSTRLIYQQTNILLEQVLSLLPISMPSNSKLVQALQSNLNLNVLVIEYHILLSRLSLLRQCLPHVAMLLSLGMIDGLCQRYIRRLRAGRESASLYHGAKATVIVCLLISLILFLALPVSITSLLKVLFINICIATVFVAIACQFYKKYL